MTGDVHQWTPLFERIQERLFSKELLRKDLPVNDAVWVRLRPKDLHLVVDEIPKYNAEQRAMLERVILAVSAEAALPSQREADATV